MSHIQNSSTDQNLGQVLEEQSCVWYKATGPHECLTVYLISYIVKFSSNIKGCIPLTPFAGLLYKISLLFSDVPYLLGLKEQKKPKPK